MSFIIIIIFILTHLGIQTGSQGANMGIIIIIIIINIIILAHMGGCWQALRSPPRLEHHPRGHSDTLDHPPIGNSRCSGHQQSNSGKSPFPLPSGQEWDSKD
ncbi:hypothetical protein TURU_012853 [Turdus rufiventris]|nr:hypothetical protein TURU_012853 [Turdus rufiventris]